MPYKGSQSPRIASRKDTGVFAMAAGDTLEVWISRYLLLAIEGVRSEEVAAKIALHLDRFRSFLAEAYGHDRISTVVRRDVVEWQQHLAGSLRSVHRERSSGFPVGVHILGGGTCSRGVPSG